ncbi:MAG: alpha/beta hydrolase-fold protein [Bacteroidota bacterium]|nr:alpha/beta hydrolase-fold protein [Bacteroidota bacterium]
MNKKKIFCAFWLFAQSFLIFGQQKVTFKTGSLYPPKQAGEHLFMAGDFNGWNPADKAWELMPDAPGSYKLLKDLQRGIYHFKITRGGWQTVECTKTGNAIDNRAVNILNDTTIVMNVENWQDYFIPQAKQHTASAQVHIITEKFDMPQLGRQRRVWIYLPVDYQSSGKKFPVIYMHDGQNLFDSFTSGYGEWGVDEILDKLGDKKECIVVGIDHGGDYRITEYDPYNSKYGKGRGDDYVDFIVKSLKPYIDSHYRTQPNAINTTIAGSSMGGLISMYAALKYPNVFGNAGIFSPAFWIAPAIYKYAEQQKLPATSRFYFVCGDSEDETMVADMKKMVTIIRSKIPDEKKSPVIIIKGASHNEKQWNGDFPGFYSWLIK